MEIAPLSVRELVLDERCRFEPPYAADVVTLPDKVWFIKRAIRQQIPFVTPMHPFDASRYDLPQGFRLFKGAPSRADLDEAYVDLTRLFYDYDRSKENAHKLPPSLLVSDQSYRGLVYLFTGDGGVTQYYPETQKFLSRWYPAASKLVETYAHELADIYAVPKHARARFFENYMQVIVLRYEPNAGIWPHIDNVARYDQGPIATVSVGPPRVYYDMTPTLCASESNMPIRVEFREGDLAIMDGSARMEWAHGLPSYVPASKIKYSILFKFDCFGATSRTYNEILDDYVVTSGVWQE